MMSIATQYMSVASGRLVGAALGAVIAAGVLASTLGSQGVWLLAAALGFMVFALLDRAIRTRQCGFAAAAIAAKLIGQLQERPRNVFEIFAAHAGDGSALHDALFALCVLDGAGLLEIHEPFGDRTRDLVDGRRRRILAADVVTLSAAGHRAADRLDRDARAIVTSPSILHHAFEGYLEVERQCRAFADEREASRRRHYSWNRPLAMPRRHTTRAGIEIKEAVG